MQKRDFLHFLSCCIHVFLSTVLATSEAELQELVDHLDRVSCKYSLLINVDKTKVMASDGIAWRILIQNELGLLEQVDKFPYIGSLITKRWRVYDGIPYQARHQFFSNRIVDIWDSLPVAVVLSPSVAVFKRNLA